MELIRFFTRYAPGSVVLAIAAGILSGACNGGLLVLFSAALQGGERHSRAALAWSFVALCLFLPLTRFVSEVLLARLSQGVLFDLRMHLSRQILSAPLRRLEEIGATRVMTTITDDIPRITSTLSIIPALCINVAIVVSALVYLGWLSGVVLLTVLFFLVLGVATYQLPIIWARRSFKAAREDSDALFAHFRNLTQGAKELKLHRERRRAFLTEDLRTTAESFRRHNITGLTTYTTAASLGQILVFVLVGTLLFGLPTLMRLDALTLTGCTITLLYLMSPMQIIMNSIPGLGRAGVSLSKLEGLRRELNVGEVEVWPDVSSDNGDRCQSLMLEGVTHTYHETGGDAFTLGPLNMTLHPGELVFLAGGNGSGKTTLAKIITGLYTPEVGEVFLNGQLITDENRESYRQHFSAVFSDFHLFESLLGLERPRLDDHARATLERLRLSNEVQIKDGLLSTTKLSQGQRKRLALLTALLEDRSVYVFDEWAADQDPLFKEVFYYEFLLELKARGKVVLVISHDDRYYKVADRLIKLESGRILYDRHVGRSNGSAVKSRD
jgi:putative ATP-binding cassette transporter